MKSDFWVGQELWYVPENQRYENPRAVTVVKIGSQWVALEDGNRVDMDSLWVDGRGFSSPGKCYFSREEWEETTAAQKAFSKFVRALGYRPNDGVSVSDIVAAAALLKVELK